MANSVSHRSDAMNNIFITLNLAVIAAVSIMWNIKSLFILVLGIVVCAIWLLFIRNYKLLNVEKFNVINTIEKKLPIMFIILYGIVIVTIIIMKFCSKKRLYDIPFIDQSLLELFKNLFQL